MKARMYAHASEARAKPSFAADSPSDRKGSSARDKTAGALEGYSFRLHDELADLFSGDATTSGAAEELATFIGQRKGNAIYVELLFHLTSLRFEPSQARDHWQAIVRHKNKLSAQLGRNVGVRVAAVDYFVNIVGQLAHPRLIEPAMLDRLYRDATLDPLTQLANRRHFQESLTSEVTHARRFQKGLVLAVLDLDNFKQVNDTHGHPAGDAVLAKVAETLRGSIRERDMVGRWGGEEFVVLLTDTSASRGASTIERLREAINAAVEEYGVTVSGGVAYLPEDGLDESSLFAAADAALYRAKADGKNRIHVSDRVDHAAE